MYGGGFVKECALEILPDILKQSREVDEKGTAIAFIF